MKAIVAVDNNWGIGSEGNLLVRIPEDMKQFKEKTIGNVIVVGYNTFNSFPNGEPLKERTNIVLTSKNIQIPGVIVAHNLDELAEILLAYNTDKIYVCGGAVVYAELLPYCDEALVTRIYASFRADKYFPNLEELDNWCLIKCTEKNNYKGIEYNFKTYRNEQPKQLIKH